MLGHAMRAFRMLGSLETIYVHSAHTKRFNDYVICPQEVDNAWRMRLHMPTHCHREGDPLTYDLRKRLQHVHKRCELVYSSHWFRKTFVTCMEVALHHHSEETTLIS